MSQPHYIVSTLGLGSLSIMPKPDVTDSPSAFFASLRSSGVTHILSLLSEQDIAKLKLELESQWCENEGIHFSHFPIVDYSVPESSSEFLDKAKVLHEAISSGQHWLIHCHGGIGRSGMMAVAILIQEGYTPAEAIKKVSSARGVPVPDTDVQKEFLLNLKLPQNTGDGFFC